jgi:hypothetical protein
MEKNMDLKKYVVDAARSGEVWNHFIAPWVYRAMSVRDAKKYHRLHQSELRKLCERGISKCVHCEYNCVRLSSGKVLFF